MINEINTNIIATEQIHKYNEIVSGLEKNYSALSNDPSNKKIIDKMCLIQAELKSINDECMKKVDDHKNFVLYFTKSFSMKDPYKCKICYDHEIKFFSDCGHTICEECYEKVKNNSQCYYCRFKVKKYYKLFLE